MATLHITAYKRLRFTLPKSHLATSFICGTLYATAAILLLIPIIAMQFTDEVNWNLFDFIIAGILLFSIGFACELVLKKVKNIFHRLLLFIMLLAVFFIVWAELAVGIF